MPADFAPQGAGEPGPPPPRPTGGVDAIRGPAWRALVRWWPILLLLGYLTATVAIFVLGPIPYPVANPWTTYLFLLAAHVALLLGYLIVPFRIPDAQPAPRDHWMFSAPRLLTTSAILGIVIQIPATLFMTRGSLDLVAALRDPGTAYRSAYEMSINTTNPWSYPLMLVAPLVALALPLTLYYWRELSFGQRSLGVVAIFVGWASGAILGRYKTTADLLIIGFVFVLVHFFRRDRAPGARRCVQVLAVAVVVAALFLSLFMNTITGRGVRADPQYVASIDARMDFENALVRPFPQQLRPTIGLLYRYLTQGYYGLSLSMRLDFVWTYGLGNSYFLHLAQERFLGSEHARQNAYPARVEEEFGYPMLRSWHSIYPWLASDITFLGTLIFVAIVGMLLAATWFETRSGANPFSVSMFTHLCLMVFYFNANNQMLGFPIQFSATVGTTALWLLTRYRLRATANG